MSSIYNSENMNPTNAANVNYIKKKAQYWFDIDSLPTIVDNNIKWGLIYYIQICFEI